MGIVVVGGIVIVMIVVLAVCHRRSNLRQVTTNKLPEYLDKSVIVDTVRKAEEKRGLLRSG